MRGGLNLESILTSIKKLLGIEEDYTHFDQDIIVNINAVLMGLSQIGVGPPAGYWVSDKTQTWSDYLGESNNLEAVKTYIYLKVRILFDPPSSSFVLLSMEKIITEFEWRLNIQVDKPILEVVEEDA